MKRATGATPGRRLARGAAGGALLLFGAGAVAGSAGTGDVILQPAQALQIDPRVTVVERPRQPGRGHFYITFVREQSATLLTKFYESHFDPDAEVVPLRTLYGDTTIPSSEQRQQEGAAQIADSRAQAQVAAFRALGYHVDARRQVAVATITGQSKANGALRPGDVIERAGGVAVRAPGDLARALRPLRPGDRVALVVRRGARTLAPTVTTIRGTAGRVAIGVALMTTVAVDPRRLPYKVTIASGDIGGPSAGLMFALSIVNRLSATDLTHGRKIAGTGTIDADGTVGPIGGARQKVVGAREAGATIFFVPAYCTRAVCNEREARPGAVGITLAPVKTLGDALAYLRRLR